jgi:hypothetical protein
VGWDGQGHRRCGSPRRVAGQQDRRQRHDSRSASPDRLARLRRHLEGVKELEDALAGDADLELIRRISASVGTEGGAAHVLVIFQREIPAVIWGVSGWDRTWVEGSANLLEEALAKGAQRPWWEPWVKSERALPIATVAASIAFTTALFATALEDTTRKLVAGVGAAIGVPLMLGLAVAFLMQRYRIPLEILGPGEQTKWRRERRTALGLLGSAMLFVLGAITVAIVTRLIG